jgi:nucleotide-binding universal stress UspA family protein
MKFAKILLPTDYSSFSDYAAEVAQALARAAGGTVELVHVYAAPTTILPDGSVLPVEPAALVAATERADEAMAEAKRRFEAAAPEVPVAGRVVLGDAPDELLTLARSGRFDVIIMGTHGRTGIRRLLMGSVADSVTRRSPIPVLAVRIPPVEQASEHRSDAAHP